MKKAICIGLAFLLLMGSLSGCMQSANDEEIEIIQPQNDCITIVELENIDQLENEVDCVVQGVLRDDPEEVLRTTPFVSPDGTPLSEVTTGGWTISTLDVTKVFKGDVKVGDAIRLDEPYHTQDHAQTSMVIDPFFPNIYVPAEKGKEYLFFLNYQDESRKKFAGTYAVSSRLCNHFPIVSPNERLSADGFYAQNMSDAEREWMGSDGTYQKFYQQAIDKYME